MNKVKKYFYDWKSSVSYGGTGHYVLNSEKIKIVAGITAFIILLISFYFGTTVIVNDEILDKKIGGLLGMGTIIIVIAISSLLTAGINWILNKILR